MADPCEVDGQHHAGVVVVDLACARGHDQLLRVCNACAWRLTSGPPNATCPLCAEDAGLDDVSAGVAVLCGWCRRGGHRFCRSLDAGRRIMLQGLPPTTPEGYCACTCDLGDERVPGAGEARRAPVEAWFAEWVEVS